jgi:Viral BACON domain
VRVISCPNCYEPLPGIAKYCARCGEQLSTSALILDLVDEDLIAPTIKINPRPGALKAPRFYGLGNGNSTRSQRSSSRLTATVHRSRRNGEASSSSTIVATQPRSNELDVIDDELQRRANWEKVVTHKTSRVTPDLVTPPSIPAVYKSPAGATPPALIGVRSIAPKQPPQLQTRFFSWISILVLFCLLLGGVFGLVVSYGRGFFNQASHTSNVFALKVTPSNAVIGGIITLHGTAFSLNGRVGLTRDASITLVDTHGMNIIHADSQGTFSDSVIVDPSWEPGAHIIRAEDAMLHKSASFTVFVTGQGIPLHPSHLLFSSNAIDLGTGDQATNTTQVITLTNTGGGQITWQATVTQPWLLVSPKSGTLAFNQKMNIEVAADRSNLKVGAYAAGLVFISNTGQATLPVKMIVTQLQPGHRAVLQLSPALLAFTGTDGASSPQSQEVTISNPGVLPLQWSATSATSDGSSWLSMYPLSGTVAKGSSQPVAISVNTSIMLPGVYSGWLTFTSQGTVPIKGSPQTIFVSLVVAPQCSIQVSPGGLSFAGAYLQSSPNGQGISLGASQGCSTSMAWSATATTTSGGKWLSIGPTGGVTPANPVVNVTSTGLKPGVYSGSIIFSWPAGNQTLPVTFTLGQATTPIIAAAPATIALSGISGQTVPLTQTITITNPGGGTLFWHATAVTTVGGAWLGISPVSGTIAPHATGLITVTGKVLSTLTAGTYSGTISIVGTDSLGHPVSGSPMSIPVNLVVQAPCSVVAAPLALKFLGVVGGANPVAQPLAITTSGACVNAITWTATPAGGKWLTATPAGTVSATVPSATNVGVLLTGLTAGTYSGSVTIAAIDSVTKLAVGPPKSIPITLTVQTICTLQSPSARAMTFSAEAGLSPASQTFTVGVVGACAGNVTITPTATTSSGAGWLVVSAPVTVMSGGSANFTVSMASTGLAAGKYTGSISLAAVNGTAAISGSPQVVGITFNVLAAPALVAGPSAVSFNVSSGTVAQPLTITNNGGSALNWTAALGASPPGYVSLSATSGTNLAGGTTASLSVIVNATGLAGGTTVTTTVIVSAIDPLTGKTVVGSPATVTVTIKIPLPQMVLSVTSLTFTAATGTNPAPQTVNVENPGGNTLTWTVGAPSQTWLVVSPTTGSNAAGQVTPLTFNVNVAGLTAGTHTATVDITPSVGAAVTVSVTLTIT